MTYFALFVVAMIAWHKFSDGDFSFLMSLGSLISVFSFATLLAKAFFTGSVQGVSMKTITSYLIVFIARLSSILIYEGYLPYDKSGDWFYQSCETFSLIEVILLLVAMTIV